MSPIGKLTLAVLGLRLAGANGFFVGLLLGHLLIDKTRMIHKIESIMSQMDDNIRLLLPYNSRCPYHLIEGNFWGKIWGSLLGSVLFGFYGFLTLFIIGHFVFDTPKSSHANAFRKKIDDLFKDYWGTLCGGIAGFVSESNILVFCGVALGTLWDHHVLLSSFIPKLSFFRVHPETKSLENITILAAKIAKADGTVSVHEIRLFKELFDLTEQQNKHLSKIFNKAKETTQNYEKAAQKLGILTEHNLERKEKIIENLYKIAWVDGEVSSEERAILHDIARLMKLPEGNLKVIEERCEPKPMSQCKVCDFYDILGVVQNASDEEIKKRWRVLINEYHPDRIQAQGGTPAEVEASTLKMAEINAAYEEVLKARKAA